MARPNNSSELKRLIKASGYEYEADNCDRVEMVFCGPYRPWSMRATLSEHWLWLGVYICDLPESPGRRAALADLLMRLNDENALAKYSFNESTVFLELHYGSEHADAHTVSGLVSLMTACANEDYPRIVRLLTGDETLEQLGRQLQVPALGQSD